MDLTNKTLSELKAIAAELGVTPDGHRGHKQTWIRAIEAATCDRLADSEHSPGVDRQNSFFTDEQPPNRGDGKGRIEAIELQRQEAIELQRQEPIELQRQEPIELSLESMCEWAPCPDEWYETIEIIETTSSTSDSSVSLAQPSERIEQSASADFALPIERFPSMESTSPKFSIPVFSDRNSEDPPTAGSFVRLPTGSKGFPPASSVAKLASGRDPPGGDAKTM